ncbi:MAG: Ku protein [Planctomycetota bacterium]|nr:MAG: Ku protein [Planctomycetota bacterium]
MALRANWDGFLRLNLVSIPVRAYTAAAPGHGKIAFHLIHKKCHSRIRYQKVCPIHGEVPKDEIVSGYEYAKGEYILLEGKELSKLKTESDKTINIDTFIRSGDIDPLYFTERSYYLLPSGKVGEKPFAVFQKVMAQKERYAIAQMVFAGKQELVLIRPVDNLLVMTVLSYADQIKKPSTFEDEVRETAVGGKEMELAETLIEASTSKRFDLGHYRDEYTDKVRALIEAKAAGKRIVTPPAPEEPRIINLMDALRQSLSETQKGRAHANGKSGDQRGKRPQRGRHATGKRKTG